MSVTAFIRDLMSKGFTMEQALIAAESMEATSTPQRTARQERNRRYYEAHKDELASKRRLKASESDVSDGSVLKASDPRARVEDNNLPTEIPGEDKNTTAPKARVSDLADFKAELSQHLDPERVEAIVKHRRSKRGQLTGHAAKLFIRDAADCRMSLPDAVDACISRNWITVKPEYFQGRQSQPRAGSPPTSSGPKNVAEASKQALEHRGRMPHAASAQTRYLDESDDGRDRRGSDFARSFTLPANILGSF